MIWDLLLLAGLVMLPVGLLKRKTGWGLRVAVVGALFLILPFALAGPELLDGMREAYREGQQAGAEIMQSTQ